MSPKNKGRVIIWRAFPSPTPTEPEGEEKSRKHIHLVNSTPIRKDDSDNAAIMRWQKLADIAFKGTVDEEPEAEDEKMKA
jgi:hypothetical protein